MIVQSLRVHELSLLPLRSARVVVGAWALAWDGVSSVVRSPGDWLERLELRGVRLNRQLRRSLREVEREAGQNVQRLSEGALLPVRLLQTGVSDSSHYAEEEVERQVHAILDRVGIPTRDRIERLSREIEQLSARIDEELARLEA